MHLFDYLPSAKLNDVDLDWPSSDVTKGPVDWIGMLGERWMIREETAQKLSDTSKGFCGAGIYTMVRTLSTSTAALAVGRPVFWSDKKARIVTPDIAATFLLPFAGIALNVPATKGNVVMILECGEADALFNNPLTKGTPVINDNAILLHNGGVANLEVIADATAYTFAHRRVDFGIKVNAAPTAGAKSRVIVSRQNENNFVNGVI
jgi:hypothetical protein